MICQDFFQWNNSRTSAFKIVDIPASEPRRGQIEQEMKRLEEIEKQRPGFTAVFFLSPALDMEVSSGKSCVSEDT